MKVTKTLQSAIGRMVNEKKSSEIAKLNKQFIEKTNAKIPDMAAVLDEIRSYEVGGILLVNFGHSYTRSDADIPSVDFIQKNRIEFFNSELEERDRKIKELSLKYQKALENLLITVEYEKDLDKVREVFSKQGYTL